MFTALLLPLTAAAASLADCARTFATSDLLAAADTADRAFARMDEEGFQDARTDMLLRLGCVSEKLAPVAVARVHRTQALGAFLAEDPAKVAAALAAMIVAEPGHQLPLAVVPEGHPVRASLSFAAVLLRDADKRSLPQPTAGWVEADAEYTPVVHDRRALVLQQIDDQGALLGTVYRWPGESLEDWFDGPPGTAAAQAEPTAPAVTAEPVPTDREVPAPTAETSVEPSQESASDLRPGKAPVVSKPGTARQARGDVTVRGASNPRRAHAARAPLLVATSAALLGTGALYAVAAANREYFLDPDHDVDGEQLREMQSAGDALTAGWVAGSVVTLGLAIAVVVTW